MSFYPNQINGLQPTHTAPIDGSAAYTSSTSITLSGFPFTVDDTNAFVLYIIYKPSGGQWQAPLMNGINGVSIVASANVITVSGVTTPFASGDIYSIGILSLKRTTELSSNSSRVGEIRPLDSKNIVSTLVSTTNISIGDHYYPGTAGAQLGNRRDASITGDLIDADGTLTLTLEVKNHVDGTFTSSYFYDDNLNLVTNNVTVTNGTVNFAASLNNMNFELYRWVITATGATNEVRIDERKKAL